jgi:hypothetical protein
MARLMAVSGIILAAIGLMLGIASVASPGQMQIYGLTPETAAILLTGGIMSLGLAGVMQALATPRMPTAPAAYESKPDVPAFRPRSFDAGSGLATVTAVAVAATPDMPPSASTSVAETIEALEQAKSDIKAALGGNEAFDEKPSPLPVKLDTPVPEEISKPVENEAEAVEEEATEPGLFVVEEQTVRGKPARILSDGTVEAETDEGWMRFENMEHLNEYLDSLA